ncbi:MAG: metallophosphoesterase [Paracoccaceae bacterium]
MDRPAFGSRPDPANSLPPAPPTGCVRLRILATSDIHMHLLPWDYYTDRPSRLRGLSLLAGLIAQARAEVEHSILVDNGDFLQGSPIGDLIAETAAMRKDTPHPMIAAMNHLGYAAACLGNHEFSHGLEFLQGALAGARFAPLSANILTARGPDLAADSTLCQPSLLVERMIALPGQAARPLRIGLVGLTPPQVVNWENHVLKGRLSVRGMHEAAAHHLAELRGRGADLVVALAHSGLGEESSSRDHENSVVHLAKELAFDALVAGHIHTTFPGPDFAPAPHLDPARGMVFGKPVVMPGFNGSHLGLIDLDLRPGATGGWTVEGRQATLRAVYRRGPAGRIRAAVKEDERSARSPCPPMP